MPLAKKHQPSPTVATTMPAIAGPTIRALLNIDEFSPIAFSRSSRPTMSIRKACRAGTSNAFTTPSSDARTMISHTRILPVRVSAASVSASPMEALCVAMTMRWRL